MATRTKQRIIVLHTEKPVPAFRKADVSYTPELHVLRVDRFETEIGTKLEKGMVGIYLCSHDHDRRPLTGAWLPAGIGIPIRCTLVNESREPKHLSIKLFVTEAVK